MPETDEQRAEREAEIADKPQAPMPQAGPPPEIEEAELPTRDQVLAAMRGG